MGFQGQQGGDMSYGYEGDAEMFDPTSWEGDPRVDAEIVAFESDRRHRPIGYAQYDQLDAVVQIPAGAVRIVGDTIRITSSGSYPATWISYTVGNTQPYLAIDNITVIQRDAIERIMHK